MASATTLLLNSPNPILAHTNRRSHSTQTLKTHKQGKFVPNHVNICVSNFSISPNMVPPASAAELPLLASSFQLTEPANALSLPTWAIHVSSVVEWIAAMSLVWQYGEESGFESWKGLSWGMLLWHYYVCENDLSFNFNLVLIKRFQQIGIRAQFNMASNNNMLQPQLPRFEGKNYSR
ncbi:hypothetical protein ACOSQ4_019936 [Xanthoceras sorbifolium]